MPVVGFFAGHKRDEFGDIAKAGEADAEVGVLGDIVRVPAANPVARAGLIRYFGAMPMADVSTKPLAPALSAPRRVIPPRF